MKRIAIIGANEQQNPLIDLAKQRNLEAHVFAWQAGEEIGEETADFFHPISAANKEEILACCEELGVCAIVSIGSDVAALSASYCAERLGLYSNSYSCVELITNKRFLKDVLTKASLPNATYVAVGDAIPKAELDSLGFPLVVKPIDRSGGRGVRLVNNPVELYRALNEARDVSFKREAIAERYIEGEVYSCECISYDGVHTPLAITKRCVRVRDDFGFSEYRHEMPAYLSLTLSSKIKELAVMALTAVGFKHGASSVEFIVDKKGVPFINEITPSMYGDFIGTDLVPLTTGYDYLGMTLDIALGIAPVIKHHTDVVRASVDFIYSKADVPDSMEIDFAPDSPGVQRYGHYITKYPYKEFGGCPPLFSGDPNYSYFENAISLNSEYTALSLALECVKSEKVYIPYYAPSFYERTACECGKKVIKYRINEDFTPRLESCDGALVIANRTKACVEYARRQALSGREVVIDNSMAFFEEPILHPCVYNIYSLRRFFRVPDGAYLVCECLPSVSYQEDVSYKRVTPLLKSCELGESEAYKERMTTEADILSEKRGMSVLTRIMLSRIDFASEREGRALNFRRLHSLLKAYNLFLLDVSSDECREGYPLLLKEDIRDSLVSRKIYAPLMWRSLLGDEHLDTIEGQYAKSLIYLPTSQWYSEEDMTYIANTVISLLS